jgi:hypothetical protein
MHPFIDMMTLEKTLMPLDFLGSLLILLSRLIKLKKGPIIVLEDLYREQRDCVDRFFKYHTSHQGIFREIPCLSDYIRSEHYYHNSKDIPVTFKEIYEALEVGSDGDMSKDIVHPLFNLIILSIPLCYSYYGYSKELEDDINNLFYKYDQELINYKEALENK